jgi:hypothetical protein
MTDAYTFIRDVEHDLHESKTVSERTWQEWNELSCDAQFALAPAMAFLGNSPKPGKTEYARLVPEQERISASRLMLLKLNLDTDDPKWSSSVTNQSTGYCPEPESWFAVKSALDRARIEAPAGFSQEFLFRRCLYCGAVNIIKDDLFECAVCTCVLPADWNLAAEDVIGMKQASSD